MLSFRNIAVETPNNEESLLAALELHIGEAREIGESVQLGFVGIEYLRFKDRFGNKLYLRIFAHLVWIEKCVFALLQKVKQLATRGRVNTKNNGVETTKSRALKRATSRVAPRPSIA